MSKQPDEGWTATAVVFVQSHYHRCKSCASVTLGFNQQHTKLSSGAQPELQPLKEVIASSQVLQNLPHSLSPTPAHHPLAPTEING